LLQVTGLTKRYGRLTALNEVSFSIRAGEVLGLIGPNGSGKTTLFECLGGVLPSDGGRVQALRPGSGQADDRRLTPAEQSAAMFYLPDGIAPWPAQTVRWALAFVAGFFGNPRDVAHPLRGASSNFKGAVPNARLKPSATDDIVRELDLRALLDTRIGELSKGQRKRVLLAIGLLTPQPVLLADEPFDGLDLRQSRDVARTLRAHAEAGRTMLLSIHQISDAARVCDRFVLLSGGRVRGEGTFDELAAVAAAHGAACADLEEVFLALT
jgi:ABC-2 type transport system ATP-binding protein